MQPDQQIRYIDAFGDRIEVWIVLSHRKTMAIHVFPDRPVELRAPRDCPPLAIDDFLASKRQWVIDSIRSLVGGAAPVSQRYIEGERHFYLGAGLRLRLSEGNTRRVSVTDDVIAVRCKLPQDADEVKTALEAFYRKEALRLLPGRMRCCRGRFADITEDPPLSIRKMRSKWGSCTNHGEICLNSLLMQKPLAAIDFVVTHELCHLRHFAHNKSFYRLMDRVMPDWREREKLLARNDARVQMALF